VQVEKITTDTALVEPERGVVVQAKKTLPCKASRLDSQPVAAPRDPSIRKSVADCWLALELVEGRNRQVWRMTAATGHPT